jgi:hypothetical protein
LETTAAGDYLVIQGTAIDRLYVMAQRPVGLTARWTPPPTQLIFSSSSGSPLQCNYFRYTQISRMISGIREKTERCGKYAPFFSPHYEAFEFFVFGMVSGLCQ